MGSIMRTHRRARAGMNPYRLMLASADLYADAQLHSHIARNSTAVRCKTSGVFLFDCSRYVGRCMSESYCERVLSTANLVVRSDNMSLGTEEVEQTTMLRINKALMCMLDRDLSLVEGVNEDAYDVLEPPIPPTLGTYDNVHFQDVDP